MNFPRYIQDRRVILYSVKERDCMSHWGWSLLLKRWNFLPIYPHVSPGFHVQFYLGTILQCKTNQHFIMQIQPKELPFLFSFAFRAEENKSNKLVFLSRCIQTCKPIALSLLSSAAYLEQIVLLVDFQAEQIDQMNYWLTKTLLAGSSTLPTSNIKPIQIINLREQLIQKRKMLYLTVGIYSTSSIILLTDLLRGEETLSQKYLTRIIFKCPDFMKDYYHRTAWITTLVKMQQKDGKESTRFACSMVFLCSKPHYYSNQQELTQLYRNLYCKKVVLWPFGRAQIHRAIMAHKLREMEHRVSQTPSETALNEILCKLGAFLKKTYAMKYGKKISDEQILQYGDHQNKVYLKQMMKQMRQFKQLGALMNGMYSLSKLELLEMMNRLGNTQQADVWNSNNSVAMDLIQSISTSLTQEIIRVQRKEHKTTIDLKAQGISVEEDFKYQLSFDLSLVTQENEKINELIEIMESELDSQNEKKEQNRQCSLISSRLGYPDESAICLLVVAANKQAVHYIERALINRTSKEHYTRFLQKVFDHLSMNRGKRTSRIKRILERNQSKGCRVPKKGWIQTKEDDRCVLEELLYMELAHLFAVMKDIQESCYQTEASMMGLNSLFRGRLGDHKWRFIAIQQVVLICDIDRRDTLVWQGKNGLKMRVYITSLNSPCPLVAFSQHLRVINPSKIIFYNPDSTSMRALYLHHSQDSLSNLTAVHTLFFEHSHQSKAVTQELIRQDEAFWKISKHRNELSTYEDSPYVRRKTIEKRDAYEIARQELVRGSQKLGCQDVLRMEIRPVGETIAVDHREFKSQLPSYLYHYGFRVCPVSLETADFILSDSIAIEKKSVHTRDLFQSLQTGRLEKQLDRLTRLYSRPYLLIQCQDLSDCRRGNFLDFTGDTESSKFGTRRKLMQIVSKHPHLRLLWSTGLQRTCQIFRCLKDGQSDPDLSRFKTSKEAVDE